MSEITRVKINKLESGHDVSNIVEDAAERGGTGAVQLGHALGEAE